MKLVKYTVLAILIMASASGIQAQSTDIDAPTALATNVVEGEGDGKAETVYYSFTATKGDVKVIVDAKTDDRSTPIRVSLLDEDGRELLPIYVVVKGAGSREVATKRFVRETKVILKIRMDEDKQVNLLTYKIKLDGAVKIDTPPVPQEVTGGDSTDSSIITTETVPSSETQQTPAADESGASGEAKPKVTLKEKIKKKIKEETKKNAKEILDR